MPIKVTTTVQPHDDTFHAVGRRHDPFVGFIISRCWRGTRYSTTVGLIKCMWDPSVACFHGSDCLSAVLSAVLCQQGSKLIIRLLESFSIVRLILNSNSTMASPSNSNMDVALLSCGLPHLTLQLPGQLIANVESFRPLVGRGMKPGIPILPPQ